MGCDIHSYAERRVGDRYEHVVDRVFDAGYDGHTTSEPFGCRSYGVFGFLAGVRNYSDVTPLAERRGWPDDASTHAAGEFAEWAGDAHSPSWLSVEELSSFDYDQPMEDRRVGRQLSPNLYSGAETAEPGDGKLTTYREFLGDDFFCDLDALKSIGADRVVFFFDN